MMKRFTSLAAAAIVAAVGLSPAWGQDVQGEDYTSHLANPSFTEGAGTRPGDTIAVTGRGNVYVPAGWKMTYSNSVMTWDQQFLSYADYETMASSIGTDAFRIPLLSPQDGDGYFFFHGITGAGTDEGPYTLTQQLTTLPAGRYTLTYYEAFKVRAADVVDPKPVMRVTTPAGVGESPLTVYGTDASPEDWTAASVDFVVLEDNDTVTLGLYYEPPTYGEQHIYLDNFKLYRIGDATLQDLINAVNVQTQEVQAELMNAHASLDFQIIPEGWEDIMYMYEDGEGMDTITSVAGAEAYQAQVQWWVNRADSLLTYRPELQTLTDSLGELITAAEFGGLEALQTLKASNEELLAVASLPADIVAAIPVTEETIFTYLKEGTLNAATYENPANVTSFFIVNPGCEGVQAQESPEGWTVTTNSGQPYIYTGDRYLPDGETLNPTMYFNTWDPTPGYVEYTAVQTIGPLPAGIYSLQALMCRDGSTGAYLFAKSGDAYYSTECLYDLSVLDTVIVQTIPVLNDGDSITIGITCEAEKFWAGANQHDGTIISGDDFELHYYGSDMSPLKDILSEAITELEEFMADEDNTATALKGDMASAQSVLANAKTVLANEDIASYGTALSGVYMQSGIITGSVNAATSVQYAVDTTNTILTESAEKLGTLKALLEDQATVASTWLISEDAIADDADALLEGFNELWAMAADTIRAWDKLHIEVGDATSLLINPDCLTGTVEGNDFAEGYHKETTGSFTLQWVAETDGFFQTSTPHAHLCFWSGSVPADSIRFDVYQNVGGIPSGYYRMTVMAVAGANDPGTVAEPVKAFSNGNVVFYAIGDVDHEVQVPIRHAAYEAGDTIVTATTTGEDSVSYYCNQVYQYTLDRILVNHGEFRFGVKTIGPMNINTVRFYGFTLEYLEPVDYEPYPDAIEEVGADAAELKAYAQNGYIIVETDEPYTIVSANGGVVPDTDAQLVPGVYIVRAGSKTVKVVVD